VSLVAERTGITGQRGRRARLFLRSLAAFAAGLTDVSFYTTELPEYAVVELARGLHPEVVHLSAAAHCTRPHHALSADFAPHGRK
jgi:hypothetical protein